MKFLEVVTPPYIYHGFSNQKKLWEDKFTALNMKSCGCCNVRRNKEIKNGEKYIALDIYLQLECLYKREVTVRECSAPMRHKYSVTYQRKY